MTDILLAIDMGGSMYMVGLVAKDGRILDSVRDQWRSFSGDTVLPQVIKTARLLTEKHPNIRLLGGGATIPGLADAHQGVWLEASFSGIRNLQVAQTLSREFGVPVNCQGISGRKTTPVPLIAPLNQRLGVQCCQQEYDSTP